jgi:cysteinyl-tRNA synthetase
MIELYDTLRRKKEPLEPLIGEEVSLYVCGITPYSKAHLGHALHALIFDMLRRYLEWTGLKVRHIQNFTDIDDKIIDRSRELEITTTELATSNTTDYLQALRALNVLPATEYPRATTEMPIIIQVIKGLIEKNHAYPSNGDVYYHVRSKEDYGKLSGHNINDLQSGARIPQGEMKKDPLDFALWKQAKPGEPAWESPWGKGRPGWHIECSAMAINALGQNIDIHGGGADLIFPHHENEIAQSEAFTGKAPFARFWIHNALLQLGEDKMSKSSGNLISIDEVLQHTNADGLRLFVASSHYRSPIKYTPEALEAASTGAERLRSASLLQEVSVSGPPLVVDDERRKFRTALDDDLNTPKAVAVLFDLARAINRAHDKNQPFKEAQELLYELASVLGFTLTGLESMTHDIKPFQVLLQETGSDTNIKQEKDLPKILEALISIREELRQAKKWSDADRIRDRLSDLGVELQDSTNGTIWKL